MTEKRESLDHVAAGFLNGAMVCLLGLAIPGVILWVVLAKGIWVGFDPRAMTRDGLFQGLQLLTMLGFSVAMVRAGVGMILRQLAALRNC